VLGICFGHQLLAYALGGKVANNPRGIEVGTVAISLTDTAAQDPLFQSLPQHFMAQLSHTQSVIELPPGARLLASSEMEPNQAFAWGRNAWGIQFHPEFDEEVIPHFIGYYREALAGQALNAEQRLAEVRPTPESTALLRHFCAIVQKHEAVP
jgi:GMP synthase (glutamine-hydrolysing)